MKSQTYELSDGVKAHIPVYKVHPWIKLGYPALPTSEETNAVIVSAIGPAIADVIRGCVRGSMDNASARLAVKQALHKIGYWPNPQVAAGQRTERSDAWVDTMVKTSVAAVQSYRNWS
jgi:hypothetical protein